MTGSSQLEVQSAAESVRQGGVVLMPTETVYGLACDALNEEAVARVFQIKGRPNDNPLIVHIAALDDLSSVTNDFSETHQLLARAFWPGPLTLILPKRTQVPCITTAGLDTVAVRMPDHPMALDLIRLSGTVLAAPSANLFTRLSPTRLEDVDDEILSMVSGALNGGPCRVGLESTVLDLTGLPTILRTGHVTKSNLEVVLQQEVFMAGESSVKKSPGQYPRHYSPRARVILVKRLAPGQTGLHFEDSEYELQLTMPRDPVAYGAHLYQSLRRLDQTGADEIAVVTPPKTLDWAAVNDRLKRASSS